MKHADMLRVVIKGRVHLFFSLQFCMFAAVLYLTLHRHFAVS